MNSMNLLEKYGTVTAPSEITIQRKLPGPIERIWDYLTDSDLRRQWLASGIMPSEPGGTFELVWRSDELTEGAVARPEGFPEEQRMTSEILLFEAPHRLAFTWPPRSEVAIELKAILRRPSHPRAQAHFRPQEHDHGRRRMAHASRYPCCQGRRPHTGTLLARLAAPARGVRTAYPRMIRRNSKTSRLAA